MKIILYTSVVQYYVFNSHTLCRKSCNPDYIICLGYIVSTSSLSDLIFLDIEERNIIHEY